jgi:hypothetical protein
MSIYKKTKSDTHAALVTSLTFESNAHMSRYVGSGLAAAAALLLGSGIAHAGLIASGSVGGAPAGAVLENFDSVPLGSAGAVTPTGIRLTFNPDARALVGAIGGVAAPPYLSGGNGLGFGGGGGVQPDGQDTTTYLSTGSTGAVPGASITLTLPGPEKYFGLLWGSIDAYNTLSFYDGATLVGSFTGADILAGANGDQGVNGTLYVNFAANGGTSFDRVVATSSQYAFEFDNVAFNASAVPEPVTLAVLATGIAGLAVARRRRS